MGLQEKKLQHALENEIVPESKKTISELIGSQADIEIDWASFNDIRSLQEIEHQVLGRVVEAVRNVCSDDFAKEAMKDGFKLIRVKNLDSADGKNVSFSDGTLGLETKWEDFGSIFTPGDIKQAIEAGL